MNISENKFVSLTYALTVNGEVVDKAGAERPLEFVFGMGMLLPEFEKNIAGKVVGDKFAFTLTPETGYGELNPEAVVELPKDIFMVDGVVADDILKVGNVLPMGDNMGNRMMGKIIEIGENSIKMDFNHPMAGQTLDFEGEIVGVREATEEDMAPFVGGGCGCNDEGCNCDSGCECGDEEKSSCGCGC